MSRYHNKKSFLTLFKVQRVKQIVVRDTITPNYLDVTFKTFKCLKQTQER